MKLRVGILGLGDFWEMRHRPALRALGDRFEVQAVCTEVALQAAQAAQHFEARAVDGYRAMLGAEDIDAVLMLSPQWFGVLPILGACDYGKDVYCATAFDIATEQVETIRHRIEDAGITFMAEFPRRQAPATIRLKELIATRLGAPKLLFCHRRLTEEQANGTCRRSGCSMAQRELIELVDWCRYVVGRDPTSVMGVTHRSEADPETADYRMMSLDFSLPDQPGTGPLAQISCGHYIPSRWPEASGFRPPAAMQVSCERGAAFIDLPASLVWFDEAGRHMEQLDSERPVGEQLLSQFYRAVTSLVRQTSGLDDAYKAISVVLTAHKSACDGARIPLVFD